MRGVRLAENEWRAGGQEIAHLLAPIRAFTEETNWHAHALNDEAEAESRMAGADIGWLTLATSPV
jgi:hypothetical protein